MTNAGALLAPDAGVLVVKLSSAGDVVHSLPVATALRRRYPRVRITWAVEGWIAPLLEPHPAVDRIVRFPVMRWGQLGVEWTKRFAAAARELRAEPYDVAIDLQGLLKSAVLSLLSRAPLRIGSAHQQEGSWLVSTPAAHPPGVHVIEEYLACARLLGADGPVSFDLPIGEAARRAVDALVAACGIDADRPLVVLGPSASTARKSGPVEGWAEIAERLAEHGTVVVVGSAAQSERHALVLRRARGKIHDLTGRTTLPELVALLDRCAVHVAPDTASAHLAAALGRPVVGIYGPGDPRRNGPWGQVHRVVRSDAFCAPTCAVRCPYDTRCVRTIAAADVVRHALDAMAAGARR